MKKQWLYCFVLIFVILYAPQFSFSKDEVRFYLFYSGETGGSKVEDDFIKPLAKKYPIEVQSFSVNQLKNYDLLCNFERELKLTADKLPAVVIETRILGGEAQIREELEGLIEFHAQRGGSSWPSLKEVPVGEARCADSLDNHFGDSPSGQGNPDSELMNQGCE